MSASHAFHGILLFLGLIAYAAASASAQSSWGRTARPAPDEQPTIPGFGHVEGTRPIPGFGTDAESRVHLIKEDFDKAKERLQRYDRNRDGYIDRNEARAGRWYDEPFRFDKNHDNRLSQTELANRYAQRRLGESSQSGSNQSRSSSGQSSDERQRREREQRAREEAERRRSQYRASRESWHLAETLMQRHDINRDGRLDTSERRNMGVTSSAADTNHDRGVDRSELAQWLAQQQAEQSRGLPQELPEWFQTQDVDEDGQVTMAEFAEEWTDDKLDEFSRLDTNDDGIIVPEECLTAVNRLSAEHSNRQFKVIPNRGRIRSAIEVEDAALIADVDVQISITHTHDDHLNAYLIGPDERSVELFTAVGREDDHFDNTIIDNEAPSSIVRGRPPFAGRYQPEALSKGQPGLKQFYGQSMAGTWTLLIEAKSDRPGALHGWSLIFKNVEQTAEPTGEDEFD